MSWTALLLACAGCYLLKLAGLSVPPRLLERPLVALVADYIPVALLSGLIAVQTFASGQQIVVDARVVGLIAAALLLIARQSFLVVVCGAALVTAVLRLVQ